MNPLGAAITVALCLVVVAGSRRWAAIGIILAVCCITQGQDLNLGFHFHAVRLVLMAGLIRVYARGELKRISLNRIDKALVAYAIGLSFVSTLRVHTLDKFLFELGSLYNVFLSYFVFRALLQNEEDFRATLKLAAFAIVPFTLLIVREANSGSNIYAVFGGVMESSMVRDGQVRAQAAFRSPITAGAFGATFALLFASLLFARVQKWSAILGFIVSLVIVVSARSSGPFLGAALGFLCLALWRFRLHTRKIRWGIVVTLLGLHIVMKAPVWFLLGRISDVVGGGGYHRAYLIDKFVSTFSSWWLIGTNDTSDWMATQLVFGGADITNQYVSDGVNAGIIGVILSVVLLVRCFQSVGASMRTNRGRDLSKERLSWALGATLTGSIGILFSVTYFDQMHVIWYFLLACISAVAFDNPSVSVPLIRAEVEQIPKALGTDIPQSTRY